MNDKFDYVKIIKAYIEQVCEYESITLIGDEDDEPWHGLTKEEYLELVRIKRTIFSDPDE